jgi:hypothetical protein
MLRGWRQIATLLLAVAVVVTLVVMPPWHAGARPFGIGVPFLPGIAYAPLWAAHDDASQPRRLAWDLLIEEILIASVLAGAVLANFEVKRLTGRVPKVSTEEMQNITKE